MTRVLRHHFLRRLVLVACLLTALVVIFGAYVRLSDAGLGCPDWPGCYGTLSPHHAAEEIAAAQTAQPLGPVSMHKAWKEMIHRYLASSLGVLILCIAVLSWRRRKAGKDSRIGLPLAMVGVVIVQGLLGKWTVTLLLKPAIVTLHLVGGLTVFSLLLWLLMREREVPTKPVSASLAWAARGVLLLVITQILLGGWVSTNYAALACTDFPTCQNAWLPGMRFSDAFHLVRELGMTASGESLSLAALTAIHWTHRLGAAVVGVGVLTLAYSLMRNPGLRGHGALIATAVFMQIGLGIANVLLKLPLPIAVAHNAGALLLLGLIVSLNYRLRVAAVTRHATQRLYREAI